MQERKGGRRRKRRSRGRRASRSQVVCDLGVGLVDVLTVVGEQVKVVEVDKDLAEKSGRSGMRALTSHAS